MRAPHFPAALFAAASILTGLHPAAGAVAFDDLENPPPATAGVRSLPFPRLANVYLQGAIDESQIPQLARWDLLVLNSVWTDAQLARLRKLNPRIQLLLYVCPYAITRAPYAPNGLETELHAYARDHDLWWYDRRGTPASDWPGTSMINFTDGAPAGTAGTWRSWLGARIVRHLELHPQWDGVFLDNTWRSLSWAQGRLQLDSDCNPTHSPRGCDGGVDAAPALDTRWNAAVRSFAARLRKDLDRLGRGRNRDYAIVGNGASDYFESLNGTMIEDFPRGTGEPGNPHGYAWNRWMLGARVGYLQPLYNARPYPIAIANAGWPGTDKGPTRSTEFERHKRFTLGSTLLGDGFYSLDRAPAAHGVAWWEPEYAPDGLAPGYLGAARGAARRVRAVSGDELVPGGGFDAGLASPWWFQPEPGCEAQLVPDATTFASRSPSLGIAVQRSTGPQSVKLAVHPVHVEAGRDYTFAFWARAVPAQEITVHLYSETCPGNRCFGDVRFWAGKNLQRFEVGFTASGSGECGLDLFVGEPGSVWVDDVSLRAGDTSLLRRDFERGIVLVNATASPQVVPLGGTFQRLRAAGSAVHDGNLVTTETLPPWDARILLRVRGKAGFEPDSAGNVAAFAASPNPCRSATTLRYALAAPGVVRVRILDAAGRAVATLVDAPEPAGVHVVRWDGRDAGRRAVAAGVYFAVLETPALRRTQRLVVVR